MHSLDKYITDIVYATLLIHNYYAREAADSEVKLYKTTP
jgi:hypothetical protein